MERTIFFKIKNDFNRTKIVVGAFCILCYLALVRLSGGSLTELFWFCICVALYLYFPGKLLTRISGLSRQIPQFETPLAIVFGTGFFAVLYCVCTRLHLPFVLRFVPPLLSLCQFVFAGKMFALKMHFKKMQSDGNFLCRFLLFGMLLMLFGFAVSVKNAHPLTADAITLNQDLFWNIGNAQSFQIAFPPQDIRFSMVRLSYHYLTELIWGAFAAVSGISAYNIIAFYAAPAVLAALVCCVYALGIHFYRGNENKALLFTSTLFLCNCASLLGAFVTGVSIFGNTNFLHLITNINAQGTALIFISIFTVLFLEMARQKFNVNFRYLATFLCSFVLVCFAKGPAAAILTCSFCITMLVVLCFQKPHYGKALFCFGGVLAIFALIYTVVFASGANSSVFFGIQTLLDTPAHAWLIPYTEALHLGAFGFVLMAIVHIFCMQPLQTPLFVSGLWQDVKQFWRLPAERLLANGVIAGGMLAYFLYWHPNSSQIYFALIAIFYLNLLAVDRANQIKSGIFKKILAVCAVIGFVTTIIFSVIIIGSGTRQLARNLGLALQTSAASFTTSGDEEAMNWLHDNTPVTAQFATNRIHSTADNNDGISNVYSALSGRQAYMEGYSYAITNMGVAEAIVTQKKNNNAALFSAATSPEIIQTICRENGIQYLVYSAQYPGDTAQLSQCERVFANDAVQIFKAH
ncbi:MAG: hypothetical protein RSC58_03445 [Ruthenibacterium sp.]